jgi:branched-subunit amino acid transport protein AzlD
VTAKGDSIVGDFFQPWHLIILTVVAIPVVLSAILPYWQIFKKAGFSPALSLLMLVPFVGIVVLFVVAFSDWPALRKPPQGPGWIPPAS